MQKLPTDATNRRINDIYQIASFVFNHPGCTRQFVNDNVESVTATARSTLLNYLNAAIDYGWIERTGNSRDITYKVTGEFRSELALRMVRDKSTSRQFIPYNQDFLLEYRPNIDSYLSPLQLQHLESKGRTSFSFNMKNEDVKLAIRRFMTDISFNSSRLEGIRANYADTISFLEDGIQSNTMSPHDAVILRNHYHTIETVLAGISFPPEENDIGFSEYDIRTIHSQISDGLLQDRKMQGRLRSTPIQISHSHFIPVSIGGLISKLFTTILEKARAIKNPFEQSVFISIHLPYLQPFIDCNKRTSRIAANIPMLRAGIIPFSWAETHPETYNEAMLAIYEFNEFRPFTEIFSEAYARSSERFEILLNSREPSRVEILFAKEISEAIRNHIVEGMDIAAPLSAPPGYAHAFERIVTGILEDIIDNEMVAAPYRIPRKTLAMWRADRQQNSATDSISPHER